MSDYYHQFLASMSGIATHPQVQPPLHQYPPFSHPQLQQQQHPHMQHVQHQQQDPALQPQTQQAQHHPGIMPLSLPPHLHQQPAPSLGMQATSPGMGSNQYMSLGFYTGFSEPMMFNAHKSQRHRRKSAPGAEHVKHRRTRSGCYTCRSRRIKCDEGRPTCERCKKGKRDCVYPDPPSSKSTTAPAATASGQSFSRETPISSQQASPDTSNDEEDYDVDQEGKMDTIFDDEEAGFLDSTTNTQPEEGNSSAQQFTVTLNEKSRLPLRHSSSTSLLNLKRTMTESSAAEGGETSTAAARRARQGSETPSLASDGKSSSPATSTGTVGSFPQTSHSVASSDLFYAPSNTTAADWSHLPQDLRFFLGYFVENITHFHYCMATDSEDFIRNILPALAVQNEPLLYALVAFSAYHYILRDPTAKLQQFLQYYDQSVRLLLGILKRKEKHSLGTLLTVLQLATIEEYLGDWVNLMGHQKAALEMLTDIYTPVSVVQTPTGRAVLHWYSRFDVFVGIMGGFTTALSRDWFTALVDFYQQRLASDPTNDVIKVDECSARLRVISLNMSLLFARSKDECGSSSGVPAGGGGGLAAFPSFAPDAAFIREHALILRALHEWKHSLDAIVQVDEAGKSDSQSGSGQHPLLVTDFSHARPLREDDIVDPYQPGKLYNEPLFGVTILACEWESIVVMHELQAAQLAMAAMGATGAMPQPKMEMGQSVTTGGLSPTPYGGGGMDGMSFPENENIPKGSSVPNGKAATAATASSSEVFPGGAPGTAEALGIGGQTLAAKMSAELSGLAKRAYTVCQMFETLEMWPASPPGCLIISQAMIAISALFLPRDSRHHMWIRRKFALIETMGYIFPLTMRTRMAELFNDPSCVQWWLPNNEGFSPILQSVRAFADERNVTAVSSQAENLREIRHIFAKLQIGEGGGKDAISPTAGDSDAGGRVGGGSGDSIAQGTESFQGAKKGAKKKKSKGT